MFTHNSEVIDNLFPMSVSGRSNTIAGQRFPCCRVAHQNPAQNRTKPQLLTEGKKETKEILDLKGTAADLEAITG